MIITKASIEVTSRREGGGVVQKLNKGGASGLALFPFLIEGCSLCNYRSYVSVFCL